MENLDWSWVSLGVDENDLMCVDPIAAVASLKRVINQLIDEEVAAAAHRFGLNIHSDAMILRNRVGRHEMRRHFGSDAAPWNPALDEPSEESHSMQSPSSLSRNSADNFSSNRVLEQAEVVTSIPNRVLLSTGQAMGRFCDPISMELPSQTYRSEMQIELSDSRTANEEARADSHAAPATRGVRRQVSIAAPVAFYDLQGSNHNPRAQSTRYPLSLHPPHENSTFVENTMDLTSGA